MDAHPLVPDVFCVLTHTAPAIYSLSVQRSITSTILSSMSDGVLVLDFSGHLIFLNRAGQELLLLQEIAGKRYMDLFMGDTRNDAFNDILFDGIQNREAHVYREVPYWRSDGSRIDLAVTTSFLREGDGPEEREGIVVVFKDISELKALDRARQRVIDHLSHELKTPLAIIGATLKRLNTPETAKFVERMEQNLKRLQEIQTEVEDIVKEARGEEGAVSGSLLEQVGDLLDIVCEENEGFREPVELLKAEIQRLFATGDTRSQALEVGQHITEAVDLARTLASGRQVALGTTVEDNARIWMDPNILKKVLVAPIRNAIEATPDGGEVTVFLGQVGENAAVEIRDTGVGITPESQGQIFGGFYHAKDTNLYTTKKPFDFGAGGKGLDLLRLKILSNVYNFRIECESTRCPFIPQETDLCPGSIEACAHVQNAEECARSGGTTFRLVFPRC
jgi:PAS domain S-box-containing protein